MRLFRIAADALRRGFFGVGVHIMMALQAVVFVVFAAGDIHILVHAVAHQEERAHRARMAQVVQQPRRLGIAGAVVKGEGDQRVGAVVGLHAGLVGQHIGQGLIVNRHAHQRGMAGIDGAGLVMQRQRRRGQHEGGFQQSLAGAQAVKNGRVGLLIGKICVQLLAHGAAQDVPGGGRILHHVGQGQLTAGVHIIGAGGKGRGQLLARIGLPCQHQKAHPPGARNAVHHMDIQAAVALGVIAALEGGGVLLVISIHQRVDFGRNGGIGGGNMLLGDKAALAVDQPLIYLIGNGKGVRQAVRAGGHGGEKQRDQQRKDRQCAQSTAIHHFFLRIISIIGIIAWRCTAPAAPACGQSIPAAGRWSASGAGSAR